MLFSVNNEDVFKRYFNLEKKNNFLEPKEALILGNTFFDMYEPYKNYKPREIVANTEKEKLMLRIRELSHVVGDLNLYLDLCPDDKDTYNLFKKYVTELNELSCLYSEKYEVLELNKDVNGSYTWESGIWPWEVKKNV